MEDDSGEDKKIERETRATCQKSGDEDDDKNSKKSTRMENQQKVDKI